MLILVHRRELTESPGARVGASYELKDERNENEIKKKKRRKRETKNYH